MVEKLKQMLKPHQSMLLCCLVATFIWGMAAHAYQFLNLQFSHDALDGFYTVGIENAHKIALGRIFVPAYRFLTHGWFTLPWLSGLLALLWIGLAAFLVVRLLNVRSKGVAILICGVMAVNVTVTSLVGSFLHDLDADLFGMLLACIAAALWKKGGWLKLLTGSLLITISIGLYQSNVSMTITLIMIVLLFEVIDGKKGKDALVSGLRGALMVVVGAALYALCLYAATVLTGIAVKQDAYNSVAAVQGLTLEQLPKLLVTLYQKWWKYFRHPTVSWLVPQVTTVINLLVIGVVGLSVVRTLFERALTIAQKALILLLLFALPIGMNISCLLSCGLSHPLMQYAFVLVYVLALVLAQNKLRFSTPCLAKHEGVMRFACAGLVCLLLWSNMQTANQLYLKKSVINSVTHSHMTRILHEMTNQGYISGETTLMVSGELPIDGYPGFELTDELWGADYNDAMTGDPESMSAYFTYMLGEQATFVSAEQRKQIAGTTAFEAMPTYPQAGYIQTIDGVMVVRLD